MLNVYLKPYLRRLLGVIGFSIGAALFLSVPSFAVYYNIGMFWKGTAGAPPPPTPFTERRIAEGDSHSCAVVSDGTVKCWGLNTDGQLGDGTTTQRTTPVAVSGLTGVVSIALGVGHSCAVLSDGTVVCWGRNDHGQLGDGTTTQRNTPVAVSGLTGAVSLSEGSYHSCAALSDGSAKCWGWNADGQLGDGTGTDRYTPVAVAGLSGVVAVSLGRYATSCALLSDGTARCWGMGAWGQLGNNTTVANSTTPVVVSGINSAVSITGGTRHNCVQLSDGTMKCWGYNDYGQLGDGTTTNRLTPVAVSGLSGAVSISAGGWGSSCAALSDGTAKCWGLNSSGQLGDGTVTSRTTPVTVSGLSGVVSIATGTAQSCAALSDGTKKCWGINTNGQLGNGTTTNSSTYVSVTGSTSGPFVWKLNTVSSVVAEDNFGCAKLSDGTEKCWSSNNVYGQLGDGTNTSARVYPHTVSGLTGVVSIALSVSANCVAFSNGTAKCWGRNVEGQIGDGTTVDSVTPVTVSGLTGVVSITKGYIHGCAALSDGTAKCWGKNANGQLGDGTNTQRNAPVAVSGLTGVVSITGGNSHSCAAVSDGTAKCWGYNGYGGIGDGTTTDRTTPVTVSGLTGVVSIAGGQYHSCAALSDGTAKCWGYNLKGQLGDGTTASKSTPVTVSGLSGVVSITAGNDYSCAALSDGAAKCWGGNINGELGDGTNTNKSTPVTVSGLAGVVSITGGDKAVCAALSDGTAKCWGYNFYRQLGDGTNTYRNTPVSVTKLDIGVATANNGGGGTSLVISKPAGTLTNHVMVAGITTRGSISITTPSGWNLLSSNLVGNVGQSTYYRVATAADDGVSNYTWNMTSSKASGVIITYDGIDPAAPIITSGGTPTAASATITAPDLTTTETEFISVTFFGVASDNAITEPTGYGIAGEDASTGAGVASRTRTLAAHKRYLAAGATGAVTASVTAEDNVGQHVLLKKAP